MQIRRFSSDLKRKIPGNHPGLYGVMIQLNQAQVPPEKQEELARRFNGLPFLLDAQIQVEAMYFEPHASMEEHSADHPILFLVISGRGSLRLGGPAGETREIQSGDAALWPAHIEHAVWTEEEELYAIVINAFTHGSL